MFYYLGDDCENVRMRIRISALKKCGGLDYLEWQLIKLLSKLVRN